MIDLPRPMAVVCHDAGGANVVAHWVARTPDCVRPFVGGPGRRIWADLVHVPLFGSLEEAMDGATSLLSATSTASMIEHEARRIAKNAGIPSVAILDHWTRYPDRFELDGDRVLPDEIWVVDEPAEVVARRSFPDVPVQRVPNYYLQEQARIVEAFNPLPPRREAGHILYVLEPIQQRWFTSDARPKELQAFEFFMSHLEDMGARPDVEIVLRPHPSDPPGMYDGWPALYPNRTVSVDAMTPLSERIAWADWVVGCETFALVVANNVGRIAMSVLPPWAPPCRLPIPEILRLSDRFPAS